MIVRLFILTYFGEDCAALTIYSSPQLTRGAIKSVGRNGGARTSRCAEFKLARTLESFLSAWNLEHFCAPGGARSASVDANRRPTLLIASAAGPFLDMPVVI